MNQDDLQAALNHQQELEHQQQQDDLVTGMSARELLDLLTPELRQQVLRAAWVRGQVSDNGATVWEALVSWRNAKKSP